MNYKKIFFINLILMFLLVNIVNASFEIPKGTDMVVDSYNNPWGGAPYNDPDHLIDGLWALSANTFMHLDVSACTDDNWHTYRFNQTWNVSSIVIYNNGEFGAVRNIAYTEIFYSLDNVTFTNYTQTFLAAGTVTMEDELLANYVKLGTWCDTTYGAESPGIGEVTIFGEPYTPPPPPVAKGVNITLTKPANGDVIFNNIVNINATVQTNETSELTLFVNGKLNQTRIIVGSVNNETFGFNLSFEENIELSIDYYFLLNTTFNHVNTSNTTFFLDDANPRILFSNPLLDNSSIIGVAGLFLNLSVTDQNNLFTEINISNPLGTHIFDKYYDTNDSYVFNITDSLNLNITGTHILQILSADGHTKKKIPNIKHSIDKSIKKLDFDNQKFVIYPSISSDFADVSTVKDVDRHKFSFTKNKKKNTKFYDEFVVETKGTIYIVMDSDYPGHLIIKEGPINEWYWVDFDTIEDFPVSIIKVNDKKVLIRVYGDGRDYNFRSVGLINVISKSLSFNFDSSLYGSSETVEDSNILEGDNISFSLNVTTTGLVSNVIANLVYENSVISVAQSYNVSNVFVFEAHTIVPMISGNLPQIINNYWNFSINNTFGTQFIFNDTITQTVGLSTIFPFTLLKERDGSEFVVSDTISTTLEVLCINGTGLFFDFSITNSSNADLNVTCNYEVMKVAVIYPGSIGSYYRTLVPEPNDYRNNITFYLIDLNLETAIQRVISLADLSGDFSEGILRVVTPVSGSSQTIIKQKFDVSDEVKLFLIQNELYTLSIINDNGVERILGNLISTTAGTQTITVPTITYEAENILLENGSISRSYFPSNYSTELGLLRMTFNDSTEEITYLSFTVFNGSDTTQVLSNITSSLFNVIFTYSPTNVNQTFVTRLEYSHPDFANSIVEFRTWSTNTNLFAANKYFDLIFSDPSQVKMFVSGFFLIVWVLLFTARTISWGLGSTLFWVAILYWIGWFPISVLWISLLGLTAILGVVANYLRGGVL